MSQPEPTVSERIKTAISYISTAGGALMAIEELEATLKQIQFARCEAQAQLDRF
jgi:hypothetical protein